MALPQAVQATGTGLVQGKAVAPKVGCQSATSLCCCVPSGNVPWGCQSGEADRSSRAKNEFPAAGNKAFKLENLQTELSMEVIGYVIKRKEEMVLLDEL